MYSEAFPLARLIVTGAVGWEVRRTEKVPVVEADSLTVMAVVLTTTPNASSLVMVTVAELPLAS